MIYSVIMIMALSNAVIWLNFSVSLSLTNVANLFIKVIGWARGDLNPGPPGYEPGALPG